jgi:hypothetical protein
MKYSALLFGAFLFFLVSCNPDDSPTPVPIPATVTTIEFLVNGNATQGNYNFYSFANATTVPATDSNSTKWDFAMRFETFIINSNSSGPGNAGVQLLNQVFDAVSTAAETGYKYDTTAAQKAIKGTDWYAYNATTRTFSPIAGKTFVFRTATNQYAKMEVLSADPADDAGNPVVPPTRPTKIKYKLRIAYQKNGSKNF